MSKKNLDNKTALITGASSGLGLEISKAFIKEGANLILCSRSLTSLNKQSKELIKLKESHQKIIFFSTDITNEKEIDNLISKSLKEFKRIEILVNNAGIIGPKGNFEDLDWEEWIYALKTNLLGSAYLIKKLLPIFKKNNYGRIIQISGGGATSPLPYQSIYAASKAGIVRLIETIACEVKDFNISANCIAPGALNTKILDEYIQSGPSKLGKTFYQKILKQRELGGAPIEKAVNLSVALASENFPLLRGKLISAVWDDWENIEQFYSELKNTDVYTLRRITAKDRSFKWGDL
tara:strand:- start:1419 stop:2297 length:879 start_codon:yes stop_codon:yes gene_type:complete